MNGKIICREMTGQDLAEVAVIEAMIFNDPWTREGFEGALATPGNLYITACLEERTVGYCGLYRSFEEGEIVNVAVHPDFRRRGIGEEMMRFLIRKGKEQGITRFILEVREGNESAIALYRKLGFSCLGLRKDFYEKPRENAWIMSLEYREKEKTDA